MTWEDQMNELREEVDNLRSRLAECERERDRLNMQLLADVTCSDWAKEHLAEIDRLRSEVERLQHNYDQCEVALDQKRKECEYADEVTRNESDRANKAEQSLDPYRKALEEIRNHEHLASHKCPHVTESDLDHPLRVSHSDGHRCCAALASKALKGKDEHLS